MYIRRAPGSSDNYVIVMNYKKLPGYVTEEYAKEVKEAIKEDFPEAFDYELRKEIEETGIFESFAPTVLLDIGRRALKSLKKEYARDLDSDIDRLLEEENAAFFKSELTEAQNQVNALIHDKIRENMGEGVPPRPNGFLVYRTGRFAQSVKTNFMSGNGFYYTYSYNPIYSVHEPKRRVHELIDTSVMEVLWSVAPSIAGSIVGGEYS